MTETTTYYRSDLAAARRSAFRPVFALTTAFLAVSAALIAFVIVLTAAGIPLDLAIWIRGGFVLASGVVLLLIARFASRGSRAAFVRLRIVSPIVVAALIVIVAIPGFLPAWMRVEQAVCAAILLPMVILIFLPPTSGLFPKNA
jgi:hypothetical protein